MFDINIDNMNIYIDHDKTKKVELAQNLHTTKWGWTQDYRLGTVSCLQQTTWSLNQFSDMSTLLLPWIQINH